MYSPCLFVLVGRAFDACGRTTAGAGAGAASGLAGALDTGGSLGASRVSGGAASVAGAAAGRVSTSGVDDDDRASASAVSPPQQRLTAHNQGGEPGSRFSTDISLLSRVAGDGRWRGRPARDAIRWAGCEACSRLGRCRGKLP
jgi:hypothetical protein